jgi:diacylglycerol O-acyltransferase / wax synthase
VHQLSPLDAAFLEIEDADPHVTLSIGSVAVAEGSAPAQDELVAMFTALLPLIPRYRQRVRRVPLDLGPPVWVDDPRFDPAQHFHRVALPEPGDESTLCDLIALLMSERLERDRPLWECWVIEGLDAGRWAVLSKVHHCLADGMAGNPLHEVFFHEVTPPGETAEAEPEPEPGTAQLLLGALRRLVTDPFDEAAFAAGRLLAPRELARQVADATQGFGALAAALIPVAPSSLSGPLGQQRQYELAHVSLSEVVTISKTFHVTVNDVVLAAVSAAFREVLLSRGEEPAPDVARTLVPVSVQGSGNAGSMGRQMSVMLPLLPVDLGDPALRLVAVHRRLNELKRHREADAGVAVMSSAAHGPFAPIALGIRIAARLPHRNLVSVATNVPGPRHRLSILGREVVDLYPYVPIATRLRTGVAVLTYRDRMTFGITADLSSAPERRLLADAIERDIAALTAIATVRNGPDRPQRTSSSPS